MLGYRKGIILLGFLGPTVFPHFLLGRRSFLRDMILLVNRLEIGEIDLLSPKIQLEALWTLQEAKR